MPLVTAAPAGLPANFVTASLGQPGTQVLLGGSPIDTEEHSGGRLTAGCWLDGEETVGVEGCYFFLGRRSATQGVSSPGPPTGPILANVFFSVGPLPVAGETANYLAFPGSEGSATLTVADRLQGAEANGVAGVYRNDGLRVDVLAGFRWLDFNEDLDFATTQKAVRPARRGSPVGEFADTLDRFRARNNFYAGQLGARAEYETGRWSVTAGAKVALGAVSETVIVEGLTTLNATAGMTRLIPTTTVPGGLYALPTNIGSHERQQFAVAGEVNVGVGYAVTDSVRVFCGYDFLGLSRVARGTRSTGRSTRPSCRPGPGRRPARWSARPGRRSSSMIRASGHRGLISGWRFGSK